MSPDAKPRIAAVMGWPIGHSLSPRLHGYWLRQHGIAGSYVPLAVRPEDLQKALRSLPSLGIAGTNVTIPHKELALATVDDADAVAKRIGAANTITVRPDGSLYGQNTDAFGFTENLNQGFPGWDAKAGPVVVLGAGGAARAVCVALIDAGVPEIRLVNRTLSRAETLAADLNGPFSLVSWDKGPKALDGSTLMVNTTALGMAGHETAAFDLTRLPPETIVTDIVYTPLITPLLAAARHKGNPVLDGLGMLLHQGRPGFAKWFGVEPEVTPELRDFVLAGLPQPAEDKAEG